ncbi:MAG: hypothetical protein IJO83_02705 [Clostridia bacterium]|nr:hypothetical protein [Clostridia bacterium]
MKKFLLTIFTLLLMALPCSAEPGTKPVAIKVEDGVYLSWQMEEEGREYVIYRDGAEIAKTTMTNYVDKGATGEGKYMIDTTPVEVWDKQYIEIPLSVPDPYKVEAPKMDSITLTSEKGDITFGNEWYIYTYDTGYTVFMNDEAQSIDVLDHGVEVGTGFCVYSYYNTPNQRFAIEEENGKVYLKGEQSQLYIEVFDKGDLRLAEKPNATAFSIKKTNKAVPQNVVDSVRNTLVFATYGPGDASIGDLDGDGEWEVVLKWDPSNAKDSSHGGQSGRVFIDAYELDGTHMWRIDLGVNIRAGAHDTQFLVYDLDKDGKAEVSFRISDGTIDGTGNVIGDGTKNWLDGGGRNLEGPLWVAVFEGATGKLLAKCDFDPQNVGRETSSSFGDGYGNRSERYNACVAYVDGETPHMIFQRGYYARTVVAAYKYQNGEITKVWRFDTSDEGLGRYGSNGNHNISVADSDGDGKDEIFLGSLTLDDDGSVLWCGFEGHGDAMHLGDFDPDNEGLEFFSVHESGQFGYTIHDAATGEKIFDIPGAKDTGRGMILNAGPFGGSYIVNVGSGARRINSLGEDVTAGDYGNSFRVYWDGDLYEEILGGTAIIGYAPDGGRVDIMDTWGEGCRSINGSKSTPCLTCDIFGDWREEIIWKTEDNKALRIYTTTIPTEFSLPSLMEDHTYRMGVVWQNSSYNQPPHLGYYPESGLRLWIDSENADINGMKLTVDAAPYIANGRTMVPLRFISELFDFNVEYDNGLVEISKNGSVFSTQIGTRAYTMNGQEKEMDTESVIVNDRTMVPVRVIAEAFGMSVDWNSEERVVTIKRGKAREDFVNVFTLGDEQGVTKMLDYFFDKSVGIIKVNSADEIINKAEDGDYAVMLSDADTAELESMGVTVVDATMLEIKASDNHERFKAAEKIAELMCYLPDCTSRKENGYVQTASFSGEKAFDVSIWGEVPFCRVTIEGNATVGINGENYLTWEMDDKAVIYLEGGAKELLVNVQGNAKVTIEPCNEKEKAAFKAPDDMDKVSEVAGVVRYENETKVTLYNSAKVFKKVKVGNTVVNVAPESAVTYEKKVWE